MTTEEFNIATRGITAARLAEILNRSVSTVQSYSTGRTAIPFEVAKVATALDEAIDRITIKERIMNKRDMKKVIEGKLYNTRTATMIGEYSSDYGRSDFRYMNEELYRTKNGSYFLAGEGGPMTKYSESCGDNSYCGGENIFPIDESEAKEWMERHETTEKYIAAFGQPDEA